MNDLSSPSTDVQAPLPLRRDFLKHIIRLAGPYWNSEQKWQVRGFTFALFVLTLLQVALAVWTNYWNRALFDALENRSLTQFLLQIGTFVLIFVLTMLVTALHLHVKRWLQLGWRKWLSERVIGHWLAQGRHYQLSYTAGEHDNPDGRIAEDIHIATETAIALGHTLVYSLLILGSFVDILWSVSGAANLPGTSFIVSGYMVVLAFVYAGVGTVLGWSLGRPLITWTNRLQTAEMNFRFGLARVRENSESIALMHGESVERRHTEKLFRDVEWGWNRQTFSYLWIVSFSAGYGALLPVFPVLVAAPQYIAGTMTLGVLMQAAQAFQKLTSALSWPIDNLGDMAKCRASADRVLSLYDDLRQLEAGMNISAAQRIVIGEAATPSLQIDNVTIAQPDGQILLENFSATFERGQRVLIAGDPTVTVSLFKVIAGLWPWGTGAVRLPRGQTVMFMPQRPFLPTGTLRAMLSYPAAPSSFDRKAIRYALECAGAAWLTSRLDESAAWDRILPLRVQQRLGFARVFLQQPQWIFVEEATDALDVDGEQCMFETVRRELPNSCLLTISFHIGLESLHDRKLVLNRIREERYLFQGAPIDGEERPADV